MGLVCTSAVAKSIRRQSRCWCCSSFLLVPFFSASCRSVQRLVFVAQRNSSSIGVRLLMPESIGLRAGVDNHVADVIL